MLEYHWIIKEKSKEEYIYTLSQKLNQLSPILTNILIQRGITNFDKAKNFFNPSFKNIHNPFLMKDMDKAVQRILLAETRKEKILIYGDYDVDGTTSVALMCIFLKNLSIEYDFYIPDRYKEGYGISTKGIDFAYKNQFSLIISLDCGIRSVDKVNYANSLDIDFIICDHHLPGETLPNAVAILDAKQKDCNYPYKELSGCGVGFKLVQAIVEKKNLDKNILLDLLDLVTISIACDIVPMTGENRIFCFFGLQKIQSNPRNFIKILLDDFYTQKKTITITDIVFQIGPKINAAGRIDSAKNAVHLILADSSEVKQLADIIIKNNKTRIEIESKITKDALQILQSEKEQKYKYTNVLYQHYWNKGVIGIVASRIIEHSYKPTIILTKNEGKICGSVRSINGFDVYKCLELCKSHLEQFGGHKYAAGVTIKESKINDFKNSFEQSVKKLITEEQLIPKYYIEDEILLSNINFKFFNIIKRMSPFGPQNLSPVFLTKNVIDAGDSTFIGKDLNHLRLNIIQDNVFFKGILFNFNNYEMYRKIKEKNPFHIIYHIEINKWRNKETLQLRIFDIKLSEKNILYQ